MQLAHVMSLLVYKGNPMHNILLSHLSLLPPPVPTKPTTPTGQGGIIIYYIEYTAAYLTWGVGIGDPGGGILWPGGSL
jgi:hypothetical protein